MIRSLFLILVALLTLSGCGYQLGAPKPSQMAEVHVLAVPMANNRTLEPRLSPLLTSQLVKELSQDGTYEIGKVTNSDAVLEMTIVKIDKRRLRSARTNTFRTRELGLTLEVDYVIRRNDEEGERLYQGRVRGDSNVYAEGNFQLAEAEAFQNCCRVIAMN